MDITNGGVSYVHTNLPQLQVKKCGVNGLSQLEKMSSARLGYLNLTIGVYQYVTVYKILHLTVTVYIVIHLTVTIYIISYLTCIISYSYKKIYRKIQMSKTSHTLSKQRNNRQHVLHLLCITQHAFSL